MLHGEARACSMWQRGDGSKDCAAPARDWTGPAEFAGHDISWTILLVGHKVRFSSAYPEHRSTIYRPPSLDHHLTPRLTMRSWLQQNRQETGSEHSTVSVVRHPSSSVYS